YKIPSRIGRGANSTSRTSRTSRTNSTSRTSDASRASGVGSLSSTSAPGDHHTCTGNRFPGHGVDDLPFDNSGLSLN
ncbi:MAG TPA: hypothetical protein VHW43_06410, partial [Puia sp.]|nr:hypothetical protein [Puia sp.]